MPDEVVELRRLLAEEIRRRLPGALEDRQAARHLLHAVRGSAAMAGEVELSLVVSQLGARLRAGEAGGLERVQEVLAYASTRLASGDSAFSTSWPAPPFGLEPTQQGLPRDYVEGMRARLAQLELAIQTAQDLSGELISHAEIIELAFRAVHNLKSAAAAEADHILVWYCHGLEEYIQVGRTVQLPSDLLIHELRRHRAVLAALLDEPRHALESLRRIGDVKPEERASSPAAATEFLRGEMALPDAEPALAILPAPQGAPELQGALQISDEVFDGLLSRLQSLEGVQDELSGVAHSAERLREQLREQRAQLMEALRLIGPPKPWGAPEAALRSIQAVAQRLEDSSRLLASGASLAKSSGRRLRDVAKQTRAELTDLRRVNLRWLLSRLEATALELAEQQGKRIRVDISGVGLLLDRRLATRLLDPLIQLVKNAVTHGFEPGAEGRLWLSGERAGGWMSVHVEDDGRGLGEEFLERGGAASDAGEPAERRTPVGSQGAAFLLKESAFDSAGSTQKVADAFAGRGVGLPMAEALIVSLGGSLHLTARRPRGSKLIVQFPAEDNLLDVLWLRCGAERFALPVLYAKCILKERSGLVVVPLMRCLLSARPDGLVEPFSSAFVVELDVSGAQPVFLGVSEVLGVETVRAYPLPNRIARRGLYSGAVQLSSGSLCLLLNGPAVCERALELSQPRRGS